MKQPPMFLMLLLATALSAPAASGSPLSATDPGVDKRKSAQRDGADPLSEARCPESLRPVA